MKLLFRACLQADMGMQCPTGLATLQIGFGQTTVLNLDGISLIPVIAAEHVPVATERIDLRIRAEIHKRRFILSRVHPGGVGIGDGLQLLVEHRAGIPLEIIAEDVLFPREKLAEFHIGKDVAGYLLAALVRELEIPHQRVIVLGHKELQGGDQSVLFCGEGGIPRRVAGLPEIHRRLTGAESRRPNRAVLHAKIHIEARRVDGHVVKAVAGQAEHHRGQPPAESPARLRDEGVHPSVGEIVDPGRGQVKAVKADLPPIIVKLIRQLIHGVLLQSDRSRRTASLRCRPAG